MIYRGLIFTFYLLALAGPLRFAHQENVQGVRCPSGQVKQACIDFFKKNTRPKKIKKALKAVGEYTVWFSGKPSIYHFRKNKKDIALGMFYDVFVPFIKVISPIKVFSVVKTNENKLGLGLKIGDYLWRGPAQKVFDKLWRNPNRKLTDLSDEEVRILNKYDLTERYIKAQAKFRRNPKQVLAKRYVNGVFFWAKFFSFFFGSLYAYEQWQGGLIDVGDFFTKDEYKLGKNQVQILIDTVPFPHMGIRIGPNIYTYGQTHMTVRQKASYMDSQNYQKMLKEQYPEELLDNKLGDEKFNGILDKVSFYAGEAGAWAMEKTGISDAPKTLTAITLNLTDEEYSNLQFYLEEHRGHRYKNLTGILDCATMVSKALRNTTTINFNQLIDASPGQLGSAFAAMKNKGVTFKDGDNEKPRVETLYQVSMDKSVNKKALLVRNTYVHTMESKLFLSFFFYNQSIRSYLETFYDDKDFVHLERQVKEIWDTRWKKELEGFYEEDEGLNYLYDYTEYAHTLYEEDSTDNDIYSSLTSEAQRTFIEMNSALRTSKIKGKKDDTKRVSKYDKLRNEHKKSALKEECLKYKEFLKRKFGKANLDCAKI